MELRGGAVPVHNDAERRLLAGLCALLQEFSNTSATPTSATPPAAQAPRSSARSAKRANARSKKRQEKDMSLIGSLKRLVERLERPDAQNPLQRLKAFVDSQLAGASESSDAGT
eukprot:6687165-Lingulodinium_polyedra.AAC.1